MTTALTVLPAACLQQGVCRKHSSPPQTAQIRESCCALHFFGLDSRWLSFLHCLALWPAVLPSLPSQLAPFPQQHDAWQAMHCLPPGRPLPALQLMRHHVLQGYEKVGYYSVQLMRRSFDLLTGYRPDRSMSEEKWLQRILFLETVAGEPCFVQSAGPGCTRFPSSWCSA